MPMRKMSAFIGATSVAVVTMLAISWQVFREHVVSSPPGDDAQSSLDATPMSVTLSPEKAASAGLTIVKAIERDIQPRRTLVGRLDYNADRHVAIKASVAGVLAEMRVRPGDAVTAGQVVAVVSSPEVGRVRSDIAQRRADVELARTEHEWHDAICNGVTRLVGMIREQKSPGEIEIALRTESLGNYRESLITAYSRYRLADQMTNNLTSAVNSGALPGRIQQQRTSEFESAHSAINAAAEQSLFETQQTCREAKAKLENAERQLDIGLQQLRALLGPAAPEIDKLATEPISASELSQVYVVSPIEGHVEERMFSATERVQLSDTLLVVADTAILWATADVRERDWVELDVAVGQQVQVRSPAIPDTTVTGSLLFIGRRIDPTSGAGSLVAEIVANDRRLRPGLFIQMIVPSGPSRRALVVPEQAIVVHENQSFLFVEDEANRRFHRVDVRVGQTDGGFAEIISGLSVDSPVVAEGAFLLKSELLLASEKE